MTAAAQTSSKTEERVPPNRLSCDIASDYYDREALKGIRIFFDGKEQHNVVEYHLSGGWVRIYQRDGRGNPRRERGKMVTILRHGTVEARY